MRIVHSLWTKPLLKNRWFLEGQLEASIWLYALSYLFAKQVGDKIILHTDDIGKKYLEPIPYDEIHLSLNDLKDQHQKWWSYGKIKAIELEPLGSIHIDGDVFLKKPTLRKHLDFKDSDVICQMVEAGHLFEKGYRDQLPYFDYALRNVQIEGYGYGEKAFNGGVLGFNNADLKERFIWNFKTMVKACEVDHGIMFQMDGKYEPNIIIEQYQLAGLCDLKKYKVKFVLDPIEVDRRNSLDSVTQELGFAHAWGKEKYKKDFQVKAKKLIKRMDEKLYQSIKKHCEQIKK